MTQLVDYLSPYFSELLKWDPTASTGIHAVLLCELIFTVKILGGAVIQYGSVPGFWNHENQSSINNRLFLLAL